jgi:hypothetical protein
MLLRRAKEGDKWHVIGPKEAVPADQMILGLPGAAVTSSKGGVRLDFLTDFDSPLPVLEPAVVLHEPKQCDFDFTLDRGMVEVSNHDKSPALVKFNVQGEPFQLTIPWGGRVNLQLAGVWPLGTSFHRKPNPKDKPVAHLIVLVREGSADLRHGRHEHALKAPPGPALIQWDNVTGLDETPQKLDKLPAWILPPTDKKEIERTAKLKANVAALSQQLETRDLEAILDDAVASDDPSRRRLAVVVWAATDNLDRLGKALSEAQHRDVWDAAVTALRHWIARAPGQDMKMYHGLIEVKKYKPVEAETVLQFLHGFSERDLGQPETYEMLINYLDDKRLAIRGLAHWHLVRLVPAGRKITYDPLGSVEEREQAVKAWKKLIPPGQLPKSDKAP